ncbi:MAG: GTPase, partial [Gemmatimonadota bacterium]
AEASEAGPPELHVTVENTADDAVEVGEERAIVTEEPGTTRDAIEAVVSLRGYPFRLVDTAGLREEAGRVEGMGIEVARDYLERADLVLFCAEAGRGLEPAERAFLADRDPEFE